MDDDRDRVVIETEIVVPIWSDTLLIQDGDGWVWLAQWLGRQFEARLVGDQMTYGKMRITVERVEKI